MISTDLSNRELGKIARLHIKCLPDDILPMLGSAYLTAFYRFISTSDIEELAVFKDEDSVIKGVCIITKSSETLFKRAIKNTTSAFFAAFIKKLIISFAFQKTCFSVMREIRKNKVFDPQIAFIFVDPASQGQQIGSQLILHADTYLVNQGFDCIYAKTLCDNNAKAIDFYLKNGFDHFEKIEFAGKNYYLLQKKYTA